MRILRFAVVALALLTGACSDGGNAIDAIDAAVAVDSGGPVPPSGEPVATDLPCDVGQTLATYCWTCHGTTPAPGVPQSLVTRDDLMRPSTADPGVTYAERAAVRMRQTILPMPPAGPRPVESEIAAFEAWIAAGSPAGECTVLDPFATPERCTSDLHWTLGDHESPDMHPGMACIACHSTRFRAPRLTLAGTVYPSAHEPDDCSGTGAATIEITDADGTVIRLPVRSSGNFSTTAAFTAPYTARILHDGRERAMATPQTSGDCNSCHTLAGTNGAPGRILLP